MDKHAPIEYYHTAKTSIVIDFLAFLLRHVLRPAHKAVEEYESGAFYRRPDDVAPMPKLDAQVVEVSSVLLQGRPVFTLRPKQGAPTAEKIVLYLHGGAYVNNFSKQHWKLVQQIVAETGYTVVAPDYPLAPHHTYLETFAMVEAVYKNLLTQVGAGNVLLMGDSAGGGLALALAEKMKKEQVALPAQLLLLSPWLDAALNNPEIAAVAPLDPFISVPFLLPAAKSYAGATPLSDYQLSPINGDLTGLPPISVFTGTHDIFNPDSRRFKQLMAAQGTPINYFEYHSMFHVWMLTNSAEGAAARQQIIGLLKA